MVSSHQTVWKRTRRMITIGASNAGNRSAGL